MQIFKFVFLGLKSSVNNDLQVEHIHRRFEVMSDKTKHGNFSACLDNELVRNILELIFLESVGQVQTHAELRAATGGAKGIVKRIRELQACGYDIQTHHDRFTLKRGEYILVNATKRVHANNLIANQISAKMRFDVLSRDGSTCQVCAAGAGEPHPDDAARKTILQVGRVNDGPIEDADDLSNFRTLCSYCMEGGSGVARERPLVAALLSQLRRAERGDQRAVLLFLAKKFPSEIRELSQVEGGVES